MGKQKNLVIVRSVLEQDLSVSAAATKYGVSRQWIYALSVKYRSNKLQPSLRARTPQARGT